MRLNGVCVPDWQRQNISTANLMRKDSLLTNFRHQQFADDLGMVLSEQRHHTNTSFVESGIARQRFNFIHDRLCLDPVYLATAIAGSVLYIDIDEGWRDALGRGGDA